MFVMITMKTSYRSYFFKVEQCKLQIVYCNNVERYKMTLFHWIINKTKRFYLFIYSFSSLCSSETFNGIRKKYYSFGTHFYVSSRILYRRTNVIMFRMKSLRRDIKTQSTQSGLYSNIVYSPQCEHHIDVYSLRLSLNFTVCKIATYVSQVSLPCVIISIRFQSNEKIQICLSPVHNEEFRSTSFLSQEVSLKSDFLVPIEKKLHTSMINFVEFAWFGVHWNQNGQIIIFGTIINVRRFLISKVL